ncbi:hypothetical protein K0T92_16375 [Paenibacillus oenotherae]|uniref:DUF3169 family protein n=1 Tax=Paenibacillus oenotherae TaxID=1435645 RepID=A0ABS7D8W5_9BACL|nr:hypothetical protein [Paenibacillus oenotherae]MBW7476310.1 hypothetical protein [Paenibacillus oenotherae]
MSYQGLRSLVSMITAILILGAYSTYAYGRVQSGAIAPDDMKFWAGAMLMFVGIGIVAAIVIQIIFHILLSVGVAVQEKIRKGECDGKEIEKTIESEMVADEMDKLIELKSARIGFIIVAIGFITALVSQVIHDSSAVMLNIMFVSFYAASLLGGVVQLYYYRKGV